MITALGITSALACAVMIGMILEKEIQRRQDRRAAWMVKRKLENLILRSHACARAVERRRRVEEYTKHTAANLRRKAAAL